MVKFFTNIDLFFNMTQVTKNKLEAAFSKVAVSIIIALISFIAYQAVDFKDTIVTKMDRYQKDQTQRTIEFRELYDWTHSINEFVIVPTKKLAEDNQRRINKLEPKGTDEYYYKEVQN